MNLDPPSKVKLSCPAFARMIWLCLVLIDLTGVARAAADEKLAPPTGSGYAGKQKCLICHQLEGEHWAHTAHARLFNFNPRNELEKKRCEACHGPGETHAGNPTQKGLIIAFTRDSVTPVEQQNGQCLQCHKGAQRMFWFGSPHQSKRFARSNSRISYAYASAAALTGANAALVGDAMPDILFHQHTLETSLKYRIDRNFALRLFHRYDNGHIVDWHYDQLPQLLPTELFLGAGPQNYSAHTLGILLQFKTGL